MMLCMPGLRRKIYVRLTLFSLFGFVSNSADASPSLTARARIVVMVSRQLGQAQKPVELMATRSLMRQHSTWKQCEQDVTKALPL